MTSSGLLVEGGFVYTADEHHTILPSGSVLIVDDRIVAVGDRVEVAGALARLPAEAGDRIQRLDAEGMVVLPGLVNAHWHEMFALRLPFKGALRDPSDRDDAAGFMAHGGDIPRLSLAFDSFSHVSEGMTEEEADAIARYSLWTQLRSGTTTVGDAGSLNRPDRIAAAAQALGMRASITTWASDAVCPPGENEYRRTRDADAVLSRTEELLQRYPAEPGGLVRSAASALYVTNLSDELGHGLRDLAQHYDTPFLTHVGALRNEPEAVRTYYGATSVRRLDDLGLLSERLMAIHCAFADHEERKRLVASNAHISHSPAKYGSTGESTMSETKTIPELMRSGLDVSLSTDGASLPIGGMPEAMTAAWQLHNEMAADPCHLPPTQALAMATRLAARGLRWADEIGSLEKGKQADLILIPADDWRYLLNPRPLEAFLTLGGSNDVDTVIVAGKVRLSGGHHPEFDEAAITEHYLHALRSFSARQLDLDEAVLARVFDGRS
ncbi:amidohydrolase family protein [Actinomadura rudentiformis]|uniref:Amidohydrolase family protein n=1 Tax=Actinomadura rudentiformis TaxID=359158 RepID=A0A6H9Z1F8_9ACTN|nr:amidohydrolase family protein [Actinomadura rudentiformis]KAB2346965.1 amidohydrolase family protein [Actinomadura rudentiformis]